MGKKQKTSNVVSSSWKQWLKEVDQSLMAKPLDTDQLGTLTRGIPNNDFRLTSEDSEKRTFKLCLEMQAKLQNLHKKCLKQLSETKALARPHQIKMFQDTQALISSQGDVSAVLYVINVLILLLL
jgi:hypothetical protein